MARISKARSSGSSRLNRRAKLVSLLVMMIVPPILLIGLLEGAAYLWEQRLANGPYAWELVGSRRINLEVHPAPGTGYTLFVPGGRYRWQGIPVEINSRGLRDQEVPYHKAPGVFRVLNLGDSIVMGWGVRQEDTYGKLLEDQLNLAAPPGVRYEVLNAGVPGWAGPNALAYLQAEGLRYDPDLILLDLTIANDLYATGDVENYLRPPLDEFLRSNSYLFSFLSTQKQWIEARRAGKDRIEIIDPPTKASAYFPQDPSDPQWDSLWAVIEAFQSIADEHGIPFAVVMFPLEFQVIDPAYSTLPQEIYLERAAEAGVGAIDLLPAFQASCQSKPGGPCVLEDRYLFADVWMHPSALGHRLSADAILDYWQAQGWGPGWQPEP